MTKEVKYYFGIPFEVRSSAAAGAAPAEQAQPATQPATKPKFKVGDLVRSTKVPEAGVGVVEGYSETGACIVNYKGTWFKRCHEREDEILPTFTVGQRVRLTRNAAGYVVGDSGVVVRHVEERVWVRMDDRGVLRAFDPASLEAADCTERNGQRKIKAGDWVRCLKDCGSGGFKAGHTYQVASVFESFGQPRISVSCDSEGEPNGWCTEYFELVTADDCPQDNAQLRDPEEGLSAFTVIADKFFIDRPTTQPAIVIRIANGQPRPADQPYVHASVEAATTEAKRLARNNPGQEFAVYQRVAGRVCEATYEMKEVA